MTDKLTIGIPKINGFQCNYCVYFCASRNSIVKHLSLKHDVTGSPISTCVVQRLHSYNRKYFKVNQPGKDLGGSLNRDRDFWAIKGIFKQREEDTRLLPKWYVELGYHQLISNFTNNDEIIALTKVAENGPLSYLSEACLFLVNRYNSLVKEMPHSLRIKFASAKNPTFNFLQNPETVKRYAKNLCRFLSFWVRVSIDPDILEVSDEIITKGNELFNYLDQIHDHLQIHDEVVGIGNRDAVCQDIARKCHELILFVTEYPVASFSRADSILVKFVILAPVVEDKIVSVLHTTQPIAALKFVMKAATAYNIKELNPYQIDLPAVLKYCRPNDDIFSSFNYLEEISSYLTTVVMNEPKRLKINSNKDGECVVNGKVVTIEHIRALYVNALSNIEERIKALIEDGILPNVNLEDFIGDNHASTEVGYSILSCQPSTKNMKYKLRQQLIKSLYSHDEIFNIGVCNKFLREVQIIGELFSVLIHVSSGQPSRATELRN